MIYNCIYTDHETTEDIILIQLEEMYVHWRKMAGALGLENMIGAIEKHYGCVSHPDWCCEAYYRGFGYMWTVDSLIPRLCLSLVCADLCTHRTLL